MRLDFEARKKFYENELASGEIFESNGDLFLSATATREGMEKLKDAEFPENSVTVLGFPKSGCHLMMSILDAIGVRRLETLLPNDKVFFFPMEFTPNVAALDEQIAAIRRNPDLVHTTHCHVHPGNFPLGHKGKIIFVERDTPAIAVSAFHFFKKLPFLEAYIKQHKIDEDINKFARFMFDGKNYIGHPEDYNQQWKRFAKEHPELKIEFFKFEDVMADKEKEIARLLDFLEIKNSDPVKIAEKSGLQKAREMRKTAAERKGIKFDEDVIFRSGTSNGWKEELSKETIAYYESLQI